MSQAVIKVGHTSDNSPFAASVVLGRNLAVRGGFPSELSAKTWSATIAKKLEKYNQILSEKFGVPGLGDFRTERMDS